MDPSRSGVFFTGPTSDVPMNEILTYHPRVYTIVPTCIWSSSLKRLVRRNRPKEGVWVKPLFKRQETTFLKMLSRRVRNEKLCSFQMKSEVVVNCNLFFKIELL